MCRQEEVLLIAPPPKSTARREQLFIAEPAEESPTATARPDEARFVHVSTTRLCKHRVLFFNWMNCFFFCLIPLCWTVLRLVGIHGAPGQIHQVLSLRPSMFYCCMCVSASWWYFSRERAAQTNGSTYYKQSLPGVT